jgi:hypothetical protein
LAWYIAFYECAFRVSLLTLLIEGRECIFTRFKKLLDEIESEPWLPTTTAPTLSPRTPARN